MKKSKIIGIVVGVVAVLLAILIIVAAVTIKSGLDGLTRHFNADVASYMTEYEYENGTAVEFDTVLTGFWSGWIYCENGKYSLMNEAPGQSLKTALSDVELLLRRGGAINDDEYDFTAEGYEHLEEKLKLLAPINSEYLEYSVFKSGDSIYGFVNYYDEWLHSDLICSYYVNYIDGEIILSDYSDSSVIIACNQTHCIRFENDAYYSAGIESSEKVELFRETDIETMMYRSIKDGILVYGIDSIDGEWYLSLVFYSYDGSDVQILLDKELLELKQP